MKWRNLKMICEFSGKIIHVSDYDVMLKSARCPTCGQKVGITIPDKEWHCNMAKFNRHKKNK